MYNYERRIEWSNIEFPKKLNIKTKSLSLEQLQKELKKQLFDFYALSNYYSLLQDTTIYFFIIFVRDIIIKQNKIQNDTIYDISFVCSIVPITEPSPFPYVSPIRKNFNQELFINRIDFTSLSYKYDSETFPKIDNKYAYWMKLPITYSKHRQYIIGLLGKPKPLSSYSAEDHNFYSIKKPSEAKQREEKEVENQHEQKIKIPDEILVSYIGIPDLSGIVIHRK